MLATPFFLPHLIFYYFSRRRGTEGRKVIGCVDEHKEIKKITTPEDGVKINKKGKDR